MNKRNKQGTQPDSIGVLREKVKQGVKRIGILDFNTIVDRFALLEHYIKTRNISDLKKARDEWRGAGRGFCKEIARAALAAIESDNQNDLDAIESMVDNVLYKDLFLFTPEGLRAASFFKRLVRNRTGIEPISFNQPAQTAPPVEQPDPLLDAVDEANRWIQKHSHTDKMREKYAPVIEQIREIQKQADAQESEVQK
jgi:hypothetical protein